MAVVNQDQNNNNNQQNQQQGQPLNTGGGASQGAPQGGSAPSSAQPQQRQGSGRFQNLSNYLNANQGAGQRMGQAIGTRVGGQVEKQKQETQKNLTDLASGIQAGKGEVQAGQGYSQQLQNIGQGLQNFQSMENRQQFDDAAKAAQQFAQQQDFSRFQNVQSGQAVNEQQLRDQAAKTQAIQAANQQNIQTKLGQVSTEQGRFDLLKDVYGARKYGQQYGGGAARLDQLLLQNDPSRAVDQLKTQFGQKAKDIGELGRNVSSTSEEGEQLIKSEADIVNALKTQSEANQDIFNQALGKQENIDFINSLRQQKLDEYKNAIKNRQFTGEQAEFLGLGGGQQYGTAADQLRFYNVTSDPNQYLKQAQMAQAMRDIATEQDYDAYKALQQIAANRDTGKLAGASQLGAAVQQIDSPESRLAAQIAAQDVGFRGNVGKAQSSTAQTDKVGFGGRSQSNYTASGTLADYLNTKSPTSGGWSEEYGKAVEDIRYRAADQANKQYKQMMENQLRSTGYANTGSIGAPESAAAQQYKRFGRLV